MKKISFITCLCLVMLSVFALEAYASEAGRVLNVKNKVYLVRDGQRNYANTGAVLQPKDVIETDIKSRVKLLFVDDSILNLSELSKVAVEEYLYNTDKKRSTAIYKLIEGSLKVVVGRADLDIHTPTAVASARGTSFYIQVEGVGKAMTTTLMVLDGKVEFRNINANIKGLVTIERGQMSRISVQAGPDKITPIDPKLKKQFEKQIAVLNNTDDAKLTISTKTSDGTQKQADGAKQQPTDTKKETDTTQSTVAAGTTDTTKPTTSGTVEAPKVEAPKVEAPKVEAPKVEAPKVEAPKVEAPKVEAPKVEAPKVEAPKVEAPKVEAPKVEAPKVEAPKVEAPKVEAPKVEAPKVEAPKVEAPKVEAPKVEAPKVEAPKVEAPKVEAPKVEAPKVEAPKVEAPKVEAPKVEAPKVEKNN